MLETSRSMNCGVPRRGLTISRRWFRRIRGE